MANSSLAILKGIHKIHQRILLQFPEKHLANIDTKTLSAYIRVSGSELIAEISVESKIYGAPIALLVDRDSFIWTPHPQLVSENEDIAMTEMLNEFKTTTHKLNLCGTDRMHAFRDFCQSFFRSVYR